jgi:hypothetical protein
MSIKVNILVNGKPIKKLNDGFRTWVEAHNNSKYSIEIINDSFKKRLAVVSVDGINVINGELADINSKVGYIVNANSKIIIDGWRISQEIVKEFIFTFNKNNSFSAKLGNGKENLGVIGIAIFDEQPVIDWGFLYPKIAYNSYNSGTSIAEPICCVTNNVNFQAGTAKGEALESKSYSSFFNIQDSVSEIISIFYDSKENLIKRGVIEKRKNELPKPFLNTGFCKDI